MKKEMSLKGCSKLELLEIMEKQEQEIIRLEEKLREKEEQLSSLMLKCSSGLKEQILKADEMSNPKECEGIKEKSRLSVSVEELNSMLSNLYQGEI